MSDPLLQRIFEGRGIPDVNAEEVAAVTFDGGGAADIIVSVPLTPNHSSMSSIHRL